MIRLSLSACFVGLVVRSAAAQSLVPKPGFTEKRERVQWMTLALAKPARFVPCRAPAGPALRVSSLVREGGLS
jgi:hypothetical protein